MTVPTNGSFVANLDHVLADSEAETILHVLAGVKAGDFSARMPLGWTGVTGKIADGLNDVIAANQALETELANISRAVGTQGELSKRVAVGGSAQAWSGSIDSVNGLIDALVRPTTEMQRVIGAVADGDLSKKVSVDVSGEMLNLKNTINAMVDQLNAFAGEVTRVAREVGVEGKLGGQAQSTEVSGVWKDLTDNVNQLAANLTNQVRTISEVATAVTEGDLTRQVSVEASGEVAVLKDKLNEMIRNLRETTRENVEQDWLKTNRERFTRMLQGQRDLETVSSMILSELAPLVSAQHAVFYKMSRPAQGAEPVLEMQAGYGFEERRNLATSFRLGEGLVGQCAKEKKRILLTNVPNDYIRISSGLGESAPLNIIVLPVLFEGSVRAVVELASFTPFSATHQAFLDQLPESIGLVMNTIEADTVTDDLLEQSQSQALELRSQQEELRESNEDLERQTKLLAEQNLEAERKNQEIEEAKRLVEEKAGQLSLSSKYKSEFIANMSHELRTPLNSLMILAEQLEANPDKNMTDTQVEYASVILRSGKDLLVLLNSILDLAKVESGTVKPESNELSIANLQQTLMTEFELVAQKKGLGYTVHVAADCPDALMTDTQRLNQILKNLLSNAFKFTEAGHVRVEIALAVEGWDRDVESLNDAETVLKISVVDSGIGMSEEVQGRIFEAFSQADGSTARLYGGTGLGLSICRELVTLLGGDIGVESAAGQGSLFSVYLPTTPVAPEVPLAPVEVHAPVVSPPQSAVTDELTSETVVEVEDMRRPPPAGDTDTRVFAGKRFLIVDDDFRNIFAMTALLERVRSEVVSAESGADALAILETGEEIDIILMDIMMPVMDGYATMRAIRQMDAYKTTPIVVVTGKVMFGERQRCLEAGATDYVRKPVDTKELIGAISPWLTAAVAE